MLYDATPVITELDDLVCWKTNNGAYNLDHQHDRKCERALYVDIMMHQNIRPSTYLANQLARM